MRNVRPPRCVAGATSGSRRERWTRSKSLPGKPMIELLASILSRWSWTAASPRLLAAARERAKAQWTGGREASNAQWPSTPMASRSGSSAPRPTAMTHRFCGRDSRQRGGARTAARGVERASGSRLRFRRYPQAVGGRALIGVISERGKPAPLGTTKRWVVE